MQFLNFRVRLKYVLGEKEAIFKNSKRNHQRILRAPELKRFLEKKKLIHIYV